MNYRGGLDTFVIFDTAKSVGLDVARLRKDMAAPEIDEEIIANMNLARSLRIFQTPGFIVGNHILTGQSVDMDFPNAVAVARAKQR
jgi:2-hydroxychromene-2-carboxylate isomerase